MACKRLSRVMVEHDLNRVRFGVEDFVMNNNREYASDDDYRADLYTHIR